MVERPRKSIFSKALALGIVLVEVYDVSVYVTDLLVVDRRDLPMSSEATT
jgi:hypothetical protein